MKKVLFCVLSMAMCLVVSCSDSSDESSYSNGSFDPARSSVFIRGREFEKTGEIQVMREVMTIVGNDDFYPDNYNCDQVGAFYANRTVSLSPFIMGKYEVTQELYEAVMGTNPSSCVLENDQFKNMLSGELQKYRPVDQVTWFDAVVFCNELTKLTMSEADCVYEISDIKFDEGWNKYRVSANVKFDRTKKGYRLPTEAEWEYAARGGSFSSAEQFKYYFAGTTTSDFVSDYNSAMDEIGWYDFNLKTGITDLARGSARDPGYGSHEVGMKRANAAGLFDMSGNISEWCYDLIGDFTYGHEKDPSGPSTLPDDNSRRIVRGGSWNTWVTGCSVSRVDCAYPGQFASNMGFRVCRNAH